MSMSVEEREQMQRGINQRLAEKVMPAEIERLKKSVIILDELLEEKLKIGDAWLANRIRQVLQSTRNLIITYEKRMEVMSGEKNAEQIQKS